MHTTPTHLAAAHHRTPARCRWARAIAATLAAATLAGCSPADRDASSSPPAPSAPTRPHVDEDPDLRDVAATLPGLAARAHGHLPVHDRPGTDQPSRTLEAQTAFGSTTVLLVTDVGTDDADGWLEVILPVRPNGTTGWVRADDVELRDVDVRVEVDLAARELRVLDGDGEVVLATATAIGDADHPTPTGLFSVTDKLDTEDPDGPYGPFAIGLSARSDVLTEFAGGDGQVGIHGTNLPASIGEAASHGCLRVANHAVAELVRLLPLGTPVVIL